jgi:hypothetical protein
MRPGESAPWRNKFHCADKNPPFAPRRAARRIARLHFRRNRLFAFAVCNLPRADSRERDEKVTRKA